MLDDTLKLLIDQTASLSTARIMKDAAPVPVFGDLSKACVATIGINPSKTEFLDRHEQELDGENKRRFQTLRSLGLRSWSDATYEHRQIILQSCSKYFERNPYTRWFRPLDRVVRGAGASFWPEPGLCRACHLDLVPYATNPIWGALKDPGRDLLLETSKRSLGLLLKDSSVRLVILNGATVVERFQSTYEVEFEKKDLPPTCSLSRTSGPHVRGFGYVGKFSELAGVQLGREISALGFNHNVQSSRGVSNIIRDALRDWVSANSSVQCD
jgi:hypothetical protein